MNRRDFLVGATTLAASGIIGGKASAQTNSTEAKQRADKYKKMHEGLPIVAMLVYQDFTALDLIGPYQFLNALMDHQVILVSKEKGLHYSDTGLAIQTDMTFKECPKEVAAIVIPGGTNGTLAAAKDKETLDFVRSRAEKAKVVSSVCTGSFVLATAGLLKGKRATGHWIARDLLKEFGAIPVDERVVKDGKIVTGAGVSAGLDLGLELISILSSDNYAKLTQLWLEYDPHPKFDYGSPSKATKPDIDMLKSMAPKFRSDVAALRRSIRA
jgi:cyclohexyl-isocyanide hydratase